MRLRLSASIWIFLLLDLLGDDLLGFEELGLGEGSGFLDLCFGLLFGDLAALGGFGFFFGENGVGQGDLGFGVVFPFDRFGIVGGDGDPAVSFCEGFSDVPLLFLLGDVDFGLVNRGRGGFFPNALDVLRFIGDVGDVDVEEGEADLMEFGLDIFLDRLEEALSVLVDLFNAEARRRSGGVGR